MEEAFGRARFVQQLKKKGIDVNKMHSDNVKDAEAAKKRAVTSQSDLDSFRKKTGVTSESSEDFEPHMMYNPKTGKGTMAKVEADHIRLKRMGHSHDKPGVKESVDDLTRHTGRRLAIIIRNPSHPMHSAAKAERDRRLMKDRLGETMEKPVTEVSDKMKARYIRQASQSHQNAHAHEREAIRSGKPEKAKKFRDIMNKRNAGMTKAFGESFKEDLDVYRGIDEISTDTLHRYKDRAKYSRDKAQNSAAANYMRGTKGSGGKNDPDIKTMQKRDRGTELYYSNLANKLRKQLAQKKETTIPGGQTIMTKGDTSKKNDADRLAKIRKMLDREKKK